MSVGTLWYLGLVVAVGLERLIELAISKRNARLAFARGGYEVGAEHFRAMATLHTAFLVSCGIEPLLFSRPVVPWLASLSLAVVCAAQALRYWVIYTLGPRWNVRIIVVPGMNIETGGPYRWIRHPNYLAVVAEIVALPLVHSGYLTAIAFTLANAAVLFVRIRAEEAALGPDYRISFGARPRLVPAFDSHGRS